MSDANIREIFLLATFWVKCYKGSDQCTGIFAHERLTGISMALIIDAGQMTALIKIYL